TFVNVCIDQALPEQPVIEARDANGNLDVDFTSLVTLTSTPTALNNSMTAVGGIATFSGVEFDEGGIGVSFVASGNSLTSSASNSFNIGSEVSNLQAPTASGQATLSWTNPTECFDNDVLILASEASIDYTPLG